MNLLLYTLARSQPASLPPVWVSETHVHNEAANRTEVYWKLHTSVPLAQTIYDFIT